MAMDDLAFIVNIGLAWARVPDEGRPSVKALCCVGEITSPVTA